MVSWSASFRTICHTLFTGAARVMPHTAPSRNHTLDELEGILEDIQVDMNFSGDVVKLIQANSSKHRSHPNTTGARVQWLNLIFLCWDLASLDGAWRMLLARRPQNSVLLDTCWIITTLVGCLWSKMLHATPLKGGQTWSQVTMHSSFHPYGSVHQLELLAINAQVALDHSELLPTPLQKSSETLRSRSCLLDLAPPRLLHARRASAQSLVQFLRPHE